MSLECWIRIRSESDTNPPGGLDHRTKKGLRDADFYERSSLPRESTQPFGRENLNFRPVASHCF